MKRPNQITHYNDFYKVGDIILARADVTLMDFTQINELKVLIHTKHGKILVAKDIDAIEIALCAKPSVLEGKRLRWPKFAWVVHNLIAHPGMQLLAFFHLYKWAFWLHDVTIPRPTGRRI